MTLDIQAMLERAGLSGLQTLRLDLIDANPDNPRRDFDEAEIDALAASMLERGVLQPVSVFPANAGGRHVLRFGERRVRAARRAGLEDIPALICEPPSRAVQLVDQIIENDQRIGLGAVEMSQAIAALGEAGMTKAAIATQLGRAPAMITLYAALVEMPALLQGLADRVTIRSLHDLYRVWRRNPEAVAAFVAATPVEQINRRSVLGLADGLVMDTPPRPDLPPEDPAPDSAPPRHVSKTAPRGPGSPAAMDTGRVRVRYDGREGILLFPARPRSGYLLVRLDGEAEPHSCRMEDVRIVTVSPR